MMPTANDLKTVTDMREDAIGLLNAVNKKKNPIVIMHRNSPQAVMLSVEEYNKLIEMVDDYMDELIAMDLEKEPYKPDDYVSEEEALKELGLK
ncbi:MAG: hypothetical protein UT19_C0012G0022 [Candidatus Woesebacteria bacterium GW2011_GWB1_39_10b]|uniref:Antitoxin n=3 Tax=Candidatus Woeseibacteriota TaxID=1752722 RepID=A0A0G0QSY0_9BACT|nr:MAG: hypothetical protein US72_C0013G0015 [Microgenomates group bacterium GW2011_GWC1_38_12]KKQ93433.1 MAG: hypothetical protein UT19_C0012G0022 [Candidatus Woesebacteria bacterium GW2011_GWB1_39_10b]KKR13475.1 MAG: hypothetical protein UT40_C0016G0006 [Candidatus Woesebacteria bacterium GW2011_GWA1_39_21b]OGM65390.1 MAG: hypothetical protein A3A52_00580 [Candidatus Woesebacteria bacterium RIFCSPLOWO2_01_FULL_39_14]